VTAKPCRRAKSSDLAAQPFGVPDRIEPDKTAAEVGRTSLGTKLRRQLFTSLIAALLVIGSLLPARPVDEVRDLG
jgi:hypothetical protein